MLGKYRRAAPLLFFALPLALSAGCGGANKPAEKPLSPSDSAVALEARRLDDPRLLSFIAAAERLQAPPPQAPPAAPPPWSLGTLTLAALYFHPDLDVARSALANAQASTVTAAERPNPSVAFVPPPFLFGGVVNVVLETFGKRDARIDQADARVVAARHDLEEAGWQVRAGVRAALLALWTAEQRRDLLTAERAPMALLVSAMASRVALGNASAPELEAARITLAGLDQQRLDADHAALGARAALAGAIGVPARALAGVAINFDAFTQPPPIAGDIADGALRRAALTSRADVQAALANYAAAQAALREQLANRYPNLVLSPGYNWYQGINAFALAPGFDLPILNQNQGRIGEAVARRNAEAARFLALQAKIIAGVDQAGARYRAAAESMAAAALLLADEQRRAASLARAYRMGAADEPARLTGAIELARARATWFDAEAAERQARGELEDALQQPLLDPARLPDLAIAPRAEFAGTVPAEIPK